MIPTDQMLGNVEPINPVRNRIIALSGWRGSGKDTVADYLEEYYGYLKISFATALKDSVSHMYDIPRFWFDHRDRKDAPLARYPVIPSDPFANAIHGMLKDELRGGHWTPRALCILEGSIKRSVTNSYWIQHAVEAFRRMPTGRYIISDMRYKSEADALKMLLPKEELFLLRLERYQDIDTQDPSERDLDDYKFHATLGNTTSSVEELYKSVDWMMSHLGIPKRGRED